MQTPRPGFDFPGVSVGAIILNENNEMLLTKRGSKATNERGCWECPGGKVEFQETLQDAIKREIREELSIEITILHQLPAQNHILRNEKQHWVPTTFITRIANNQQPTIQEPEKCEEIGWFSLNNLPSPLSQITKLDIKAYKSFISKND